MKTHAHTHTHMYVHTHNLDLDFRQIAPSILNVFLGLVSVVM